ncbi:SCP2 domain-containing protein [Enterobacteriaceae bacterium LUAb1]
MTLSPILATMLQRVLNAVLWRDRSLKAVRQRLFGKSLAVVLPEFTHPLFLVFGEQQLDVLFQWDETPDCTVKTRLSALVQLHDRQQLTPLMRSGELIVEGDLQVVQQFSALIDLAELDPAEYLAPWTGDIVAESMSQIVRRTAGWLKEKVSRKKQYLTEALTEEWRIAPGPLELAWFAEEVDTAERALKDLELRLEKIE